MRSTQDREGSRLLRSSGGSLLRRARKWHQLERLVADPAVKEQLDKMKPAVPGNATDLAQDPEVARAAYLIPRGETPRAKAASAKIRKFFSDPANRAEYAQKRKRTCADPNAKSCSRNRPRHRGRWLPNPPLTRSERVARCMRKKRNYSKGSRSRWENPAFREKMLKQLAAARTKINLNRPRKADGTWEAAS